MRRTTDQEDVDAKVSTTTSLEENAERREDDGEADERNETGARLRLGSLRDVQDLRGRK